MTWWPWTHPKLFADPWSSPMFSPRRALFLRPAHPLRPLVVMVDATLLGEAKHDDTVQYLLELVAESPISAHLYAPDGPPPSAQKVTGTETGIEGVVDWVTTHPRSDGKGFEVVRLVDGVPTAAAARTDDHVFRGLATVPAEGPTHPKQTAMDPAKDAAALMVAKAMRADLFVASRPYGAGPDSDYWWTTTVMRPEDALPVIGLYLRSQGRFVLARSPALGQPPRRPDVYHRDRATFYWLAARDLIPSADGLQSACDAYEKRTGDETLADLPRGLQWRVDQVLRARDHLLTTLSVPQNIDTMDDALTELDQILLWLMAAFDICAQIAHIALGIRKPPIQNAGWQRSEWRKKAIDEQLAFAGLVEPESDGGRLLLALARLRNTVHGAAMSADGRVFAVGPHAAQTLVRLPRSSRDEVLQALDKLDGREDWGVVEGTANTGLLLKPGVFVEHLVPRAISLLDALVAATPLDRLVGRIEPTEPRQWRPARAVGDLRTRAQLGLRSDLLTGRPSHERPPRR